LTEYTEPFSLFYGIFICQAGIYRAMLL